MSLETVTYITDLDKNHPPQSDDPTESAGHLRAIKKGLEGSFPNFAGAAMSSTEAELNILDGATVTVAELNILDGVTATFTELNYNDITTLGTVEASKAVTADGSGITTNAKLASPVLNTAVSGTAVLDEDAMGSDSATQLATQQSIKAYVDTQAAAVQTEVYTSDWQAITSGGVAVSEAHGLAGQPQVIAHELKCTDASGERGYSQNDIVSISGSEGAVSRGVSTTIDGTNIAVRYGSDVAAFSIIRKDTGAYQAATNSKWNYRVIAIYHP